MRACALPGAGVSAHLRLPGHLRWRGCSGPRDASTVYGNPWFSVQAVLAVHQGRQPPVTHRRLVRRPCRRRGDGVLKVVYAGQRVGNLASDLRPDQDVTAFRPCGASEPMLRRIRVREDGRSAICNPICNPTHCDKAGRGGFLGDSDTVATLTNHHYQVWGGTSKDDGFQFSKPPPSTTRPSLRDDGRIRPAVSLAT